MYVLPFWSSQSFLLFATIRHLLIAQTLTTQQEFGLCAARQIPGRAAHLQIGYWTPIFKETVQDGISPAVAEPDRCRPQMNKSTRVPRESLWDTEDYFIRGSTLLDRSCMIEGVQVVRRAMSRQPRATTYR